MKNNLLSLVQQFLEDLTGSVSLSGCTDPG